ncbi:MAG: hypothetical protein R3F59_23175 [Myxococcota bacterium]
MDTALVAEVGLQGVEATDRPRLEVPRTRSLDGSANIDACLVAALPNDPRWDYAIGHADKLWLVEVHPASGDHCIHEVVAKAGWLKALIGSWSGPAGRALHWVASGAVSRQPAFSRKLRLLRKAGVLGPTSRLTID